MRVVTRVKERSAKGSRSASARVYCTVWRAGRVDELPRRFKHRRSEIRRDHGATRTRHGERGMPAARSDIEREIVCRRNGKRHEPTEVIPRGVVHARDVVRGGTCELLLHPCLDRIRFHHVLR